jgi:hypothetical protein
MGAVPLPPQRGAYSAALCLTRLQGTEKPRPSLPPRPRAPAPPQMQHPAVVLAFERQVLTASLPVAGVVQALGISAMADASDVPYYLAALLCGLYAALGRPLVSSFHQSRGARSIGGAPRPPPADAVVQVRRGGGVKRGRRAATRGVGVGTRRRAL